MLNKLTAHNYALSRRFGTDALARATPHSSPSRFLASAKSAPTLTPLSEAQLRGTSIMLIRYLQCHFFNKLQEYTETDKKR